MEYPDGAENGEQTIDLDQTDAIMVPELNNLDDPDNLNTTNLLEVENSKYDTEGSDDETHKLPPKEEVKLK